MAKTISCGVVILNAEREIFACHATGTSRWDLPKGLAEEGETAVETAVRETWEETSLSLDPQTLLELGAFDYLPSKRLHLFALRVAPNAIDIESCRCHSTFAHHATGLPTLEVDANAWKPLNRIESWCGKNLTRVLLSVDWKRIELLPEVAAVPIRS